MRWLDQIDTSQCKNIVSVDHPNCESSQREPDQTKSQFSFWNWRIVFVPGHLSALNFFCYNLNLQFTRSRWYLSSPEPDRPNMSDCFSSYSAHENKTKNAFYSDLNLERNQIVEAQKNRTRTLMETSRTANGRFTTKKLPISAFLVGIYDVKSSSQSRSFAYNCELSRAHISEESKIESDPWPKCCANPPRVVVKLFMLMSQKNHRLSTELNFRVFHVCTCGSHVEDQQDSIIISSGSSCASSSSSCRSLFSQKIYLRSHRAEANCWERSLKLVKLASTETEKKKRARKDFNERMGGNRLLSQPSELSEREKKVHKPAFGSAWELRSRRVQF